MRTAARVVVGSLLLLTLAPPVLASGLDEVTASLAQWARLRPSLRAEVVETVECTGSGDAPKPHTIGWGGQDGKRTYSVSCHGGATLVRCASFAGDTSPGAPRLDLRELSRDGRRYGDLPSMHQGEISDRPGEFVDPLLASTSLTTHGLLGLVGAMTNRAVREDGGSVIVSGGYKEGRVRLAFGPAPDRLVQTMEIMDGSGEVRERFRVDAWTKMGGFPAARAMTQTFWPMGPRSGPTRIVHTYRMSGLASEVDPADFTPRWEEGTRVSNVIDRRVYLWSGGRLVPDPLFDGLARKASIGRTWLFLFSGVVALLAGLTLLRRRKQVPSAVSH